MARGETYVTRTTIPDGACPLLGIEIDRIESGSSLGILVGTRAIVEIPLTLSEHTVDTPMNKNSKPIG